jgi:alanine dehydrogenase
VALPIIDAAGVAAALPMRKLIDELRRAFRETEAGGPLRSVWQLPHELGGMLGFYLMPAWLGTVVGAKLATVVPTNRARGLPTVQALIVLFDRTTGCAQLVADGTEITLRRTAAASALASTYLAREDAGRLLVVGTGALCSYLAEGHCTVRPIRLIEVWGRNPERARSAAARVRERVDPASEVAVCEDLERSVRTADIVTCATSSAEPLVFGGWLEQGTHLDLVGAHSPETREVDDAAIVRSSVWVDVAATCIAEAGELQQPIRKGLFLAADVVGDLSGLTAGSVRGRTLREEITVFKSVGAAIEDLAAARALLVPHVERGVMDASS